MKVLEASIIQGIVAATALACQAICGTSVHADILACGLDQSTRTWGCLPTSRRGPSPRPSAPFLAASVLVRWLSCAFDVRSLPAACAARLHAGERVIRIVNGRVFPAGWRVPLGDASIDRGSGESISRPDRRRPGAVVCGEVACRSRHRSRPGDRP